LELLAGSRIAAETFDDEVALVLRTHRAIPRKASAIVAATSGVIIPRAAAPEALDGYVQVTANIQRLRDALDLPIRIVAVVPTRFDQRLRIARDVLAAARGLCDGTLTTPIRENVALRSYIKVVGILAEGSLIQWLLVVGVNVQKWNEKMNRASRVAN
jgi:hypothetical protein